MHQVILYVNFSLGKYQFVLGRNKANMCNHLQKTTIVFVTYHKAVAEGVKLGLWPTGEDYTPATKQGKRSTRKRLTQFD